MDRHVPKKQRAGLRRTGTLRQWLVVLAAVILIGLVRSSRPVTSAPITPTATQKLTVYQGVAIIAPGGPTDSTLELGNAGRDITGTGDLYFRPGAGNLGSNPANYARFFESGGQAALTVPGNVGIGTTGPLNKLAVDGASAGIDVGRGTLTTSRGKLTLYGFDNTAQHSLAIGPDYSADNLRTQQLVTSANTQRFLIDTSAGNTNVAIMTGSGNVGIAQTAPGAKLAVNNPTTAGRVGAGGDAIYGYTNTGNAAISGDNPNASGWAGYFAGKVNITSPVGLCFNETDCRSSWAGAASGPKVTADVPAAAGWRRVAHIDGTNGRGQQQVTIYTTGGSYAPRSTTIRWYHDWDVTAGVSVISEVGSGFWTDVRVTDVDTGLPAGPDNSYLEVYFTQAITGLNIGLQYIGGHDTGTLYSSPPDLPVGVGGTVRVTAKANGLFALNDKLTVQSDGNVGIGTTSPGAKVDIVGSSDLLRLQGSTGSSRAYKFYTTDGPIIGNTLRLSRVDDQGFFSIGMSAVGANDFVVNNSGNVGIGTTTPGAKLDVNDTAIFRIAGTEVFRSAKDGGLTGGIVSPTGIGLYLSTNGTLGTGAFINALGNVGIGTTTPNAHLTLNKLGGSESQFADGLKIYRYTYGSVTEDYAMLNKYLGIVALTSAGVGSYGPVAIQGYNGTTVKTTAYFDTNSGNVGIGTTAPNSKLHVAGVVQSNNLYVQGDVVTTVVRTTRTDNTQQGLLRSNGWGDFTFDRSLAVGYDLAGTGFGAGNLYVSGNVGIGNTTPAGKFVVNNNLAGNGSAGDAISAYADSVNSALYAQQNNSTGWAGYFSGNVNITGSLTIGGVTKSMARVNVCQVGSSTCLGQYIYTEGTTKATIKYWYHNFVTGLLASVDVYPPCTGSDAYLTRTTVSSGSSFEVAGCTNFNREFVLSAGGLAYGGSGQYCRSSTASSGVQTDYQRSSATGGACNAITSGPAVPKYVIYEPYGTGNSPQYELR